MSEPNQNLSVETIDNAPKDGTIIAIPMLARFNNDRWEKWDDLRWQTFVKDPTQWIKDAVVNEPSP